MIKACVFDLDGTLLDTIASLEKSINITMRDLDLNDIDNASVRMFVGEGYKVFVQKSLEANGAFNKNEFNKACDIYLESFRKNCLYKIQPYTHIRELLELLKARDIRMAVFTNKLQKIAENCIYHVFGKNVFDIILGECDNVPRKPSPKGLYDIIDRLGVKKNEVLYFGDTKTDMMTGNNAGVCTVGVTWGFRDRQELEHYKPDYIINDALEAEDILRDYECTAE